jgi:hypothetical protein
VLGCWLETTAAYAQFLGAPSRRASGGQTPRMLQQSRADPNSQMLVTADEVQYDYTNERVSAVSRVQIHYAGAILEADKVIYDQRAKRLHAEGKPASRRSGPSAPPTTSRCSRTASTPPARPARRIRPARRCGR